MIDTQLFYWIGGLIMSVLGYFLKDTIDSLKETKRDLIEVRKDLSEACTRLDVLKNDHLNKHDALSEKFDDLKDSMLSLTKEIKALTLEISKKKD